MHVQFAISLSFSYQPNSWSDDLIKLECDKDTSYMAQNKRMERRFVTCFGDDGDACDILSHGVR